MALLLAGALSPLSAVADSTAVFYEALAPYGNWMEVGNYGYCWQPKNESPDWQPYRDGEWTITEAGWAWISHEPFGWAVYHYGRWLKVENMGWVWVPGTTWAPAWVSWRQGGAYIGWAPLPPEAIFRAHTGISRWSDAYFGIGPGHYRFVRSSELHCGDVASQLIPVAQSASVMRQTENVTQIMESHDLVQNAGPNVKLLANGTTAVRRLRLAIHTGSEAGKPMWEEAGTLHVRVLDLKDPNHSAPPTVNKTFSHPVFDFGWNHMGRASQISQLRFQILNEARAFVERGWSGVLPLREEGAPASP